MDSRDYHAAIDRGEYDLDPEHQRDVVHDYSWQSGIIYSALHFGDIPQVYFHTRKQPQDDGSYLSVFENLDSKQRSMSIKNYLDDRFAFNPDTTCLPKDSTIFTDLKDFLGKKYSELAVSQRQRIDQYTIQCKIWAGEMSDEQIGEFFRQRQECKKTSMGEQLNAQTQSSLKTTLEEQMKSQPLKDSIAQVKPTNNRYGRLEIMVRMLYAFTHPLSLEGDRPHGVDSTGEDILNWWSTAKSMTETEWSDFQILCDKVLTVSSQVSRNHPSQKWSKGSKSVLLPLFSIYHQYCWNISTHSFDPRQTYRVTTYLLTTPVDFADVGGNHKAIYTRRDRLVRLLSL